MSASHNTPQQTASQQNPDTPLDAPALAVSASHALAAAGQGDMVWGHVAVRDPDGRGIWIKAPGWGLEEITRGRVQLVSFDGEVVEGEGKPHKEVSIHIETMRARPEVNCTSTPTPRTRSPSRRWTSRCSRSRTTRASSAAWTSRVSAPPAASCTTPSSAARWPPRSGTPRRR